MGLLTCEWTTLTSSLIPLSTYKAGNIILFHSIFNDMEILWMLYISPKFSLIYLGVFFWGGETLGFHSPGQWSILLIKGVDADKGFKLF